MTDTAANARAGDDGPTVFTGTPEMTLLDAVVHVVEEHLVSAEPGPLGSVGVGAMHVPGVGGCICFSVHDRQGGVRVATLSASTFKPFCEAINHTLARLAAGEFNQLETRQ